MYLKKGKNSEENRTKMKERRRNDEKTGKEIRSELQMRNRRELEERKNESKKGVGEVGCWRLK